MNPDDLRAAMRARVIVLLALSVVVLVECIPGLADEVLLALGAGALIGGWVLPLLRRA